MTLNYRGSQNPTLETVERGQTLLRGAKTTVYQKRFIKIKNHWDQSKLMDAPPGEFSGSMDDTQVPSKITRLHCGLCCPASTITTGSETFRLPSYTVYLYVKYYVTLFNTTSEF